MAVNKVVMNTENGAQTLIDLTNDSVTPQTLAEGATAHDASGARIVGKLKTGVTSIVVTPSSNGKATLQDADWAEIQNNTLNTVIVVIDGEAYYALFPTITIGGTYLYSGSYSYDGEITHIRAEVDNGELTVITKSFGFDNTFTKQGEAADAKAVGDALALKANASDIPTKVSAFTNDAGYLTSVPSQYVTETELNQKGYLTQHQDISGKADKSSAETWTFKLKDGSTVTKKVVLA